MCQKLSHWLLSLDKKQLGQLNFINKLIEIEINKQKKKNCIICNIHASKIKFL